MKYIILPKGLLTVVDDHHFDRLNIFKWHSKEGYVCRHGVDGNVIYMHDEILVPKEGFMIDHKNGITLDNQESNLRHAYHWQNNFNRKINTNNTIGYKGVVYRNNRITKPYEAKIGYRKTRYHLGYFATPEDAAEAYNKAAIKYFGEFAKLNIIEERVGVGD